MLDAENTSTTNPRDTIVQWQRILRYHPAPPAHDDHISTHEYPQANFSWGDTIYDKSNDSTRFYFQNIHGLQYNKKGGKLVDICNLMKCANVDCCGLTELNTDLLQYSIQQNIMNSIRVNFGQTNHWYTMSTSQIPSSSSYKPGGTATILQGSIVGRHLTSESDDQGRWTIMTLMAKGNCKLSHITCYKTVKNDIQCAGPKTVYAQQYSMNAQNGRLLNPCPLHNFMLDLEIMLQKLIQQDHMIILGGDFNQSLQDYNQEMLRLADKFNLQEVMAQVHEEDLPSTYTRGHKCIDYVFVSSSITDSVERAGYLAYGEFLSSDHRGLFIDLHTDSLFGFDTPKMAKHTQRDIRSTNPTHVSKYIQAKHKYLCDHNVFERIKVLSTSSFFDPEAL